MLGQKLATLESLAPEDIRLADDGEEFLDRVRRLKGVSRITKLADFAANHEEADSWVVELLDYVVPALADEEVNCGMGIINTGLLASDVTEEEMRHLLQSVWEAMTWSEEYALSRREVDEAFLHGLRFLHRNNLISAEQLSHFEFNGAVLSQEEADKIDLDSAIPMQLRLTSSARHPTRMQIKGNHFLEFQVVDSVMDSPRLAAMGLQEGQLVLMVHTGHLVTRYLNFHYFPRASLFRRPLSRRALYTASKILFHLSQPWNIGKVAERWRLYFRSNGMTSVPVDSLEGQRYLTACSLAANYGYVARALVYRICFESLRSLFGNGTSPQLICDITHESTRVRTNESGKTVIVRKGAAECFPDRPAVVAGSYDVPSLLGQGIGSVKTAFSYDHGSDNFRSRQLAGSLPDSAASECVCYKAHIIRKGHISLKQERSPIHSKPAMGALARLLNTAGAVHPVAWLRPVANLTES